MKEKKTLDFIGAIFGNIIGIVFVNSVLVWRHLAHGIILDTWADTLWAANLSLVVQIVGNLILAFYHPPRLYFFIQVIFSAVNLLSVIVFYLVFPIDLSHVAGAWLNSGFRIILMIGMAGTVIGGLVNLVKAILGKEYKLKKKISAHGKNNR